MTQRTTNQSVKASRAEFCLMNFFAQWCPYCLLVKSAAMQFARRAGIEYVAVDIDLAKEKVEQYDVRSVPTVLLLRSNHCISRWNAQTNPEDLSTFFIGESGLTLHSGVTCS